MRTRLQPVTFPPSLADMGPESLDLELPWITRGAIDQLVSSLDDQDDVLDLGTGGSTLFYARRCRSVCALETDASWAQLVRGRSQQLDLRHVHVCECPNGRALAAEALAGAVRLAQATGLPHGAERYRRFDVISVDTQSPLRRDQLLLGVLDLWAGGVLVLDNWTDWVMWDELSGYSGDELLKKLKLAPDRYVVQDHRDPSWVGSGTRLVLERSRLT